ncbi:MAG: serine/threonine-protein phosphatase [Actinomycetota bacterium]|nr:serine/threonine-protein phosphatase [Actinomycetota bacterium]
MAGGGDDDAVSAMSSAEHVLEALLDADHHLAPNEIAAVIKRLGRAMGARETTAYLVDHAQRVLAVLPGSEAKSEELDVDGTVAGRAFQTELIVHGAPLDGRTTFWVPIKDGADRLGVLKAIAAEEETTTRRLSALASIIAAMVTGRRQYGDDILLARRRKPMTLPAEMRWSMLPPLTYNGPGVSVAGVLEPAYEIAGDTFDYGVNGSVVHLAILDAMGHGLEASVMASLAVSSYRNSRRSGLDLDETIDAMDAAISSQFPDDRFVTAQLATLDIETGHLRYLSAGHPAAMLVRNGRVIGDLAVEPAPPVGLGLQRPAILTASLEPGDRLLFLSDGAIEARSPEGELFGRERLGGLLERAVASGLPSSEVMRRLMHALLDHQRGNLQDDATLVLLEWPDEVDSWDPVTGR